MPSTLQDLLSFIPSQLVPCSSRMLLQFERFVMYHVKGGDGVFSQEKIKGNEIQFVHSSTIGPSEMQYFFLHLSIKSQCFTHSWLSVQSVALCKLEIASSVPVSVPSP